MKGRKGTFIWSSDGVYGSCTLKESRDKRHRTREVPGLSIGKEGWSRVSRFNGYKGNGAKVG